MTGRTIMIMAGGTGGHIMPGLAVAEVLTARGWRVLWLGNPDRMEGRLVPARGLPLIPLRFAGLRGKGAAALLKLPFLLSRACLQAWRRLGEHAPDVVLGMGGYVAFPGGAMARLRGIPLVVHEQNAIAGTANRALARIAGNVLTGFPNALPGARHLGNPVRADVRALPAPGERYAARKGALRVLVVGGSLGAEALNTLVPQAMALLPSDARPAIVHQAGEQHIDALRARYAQAGVVAECRAFIDDMAAELGAADLVICRAGAMTVAEIAAAGVAALFVPLPHAIDDHQTANARYLADHDAAWLFKQSALDPTALADVLRGMRRSELLAVAERARQYARPDAATDIADVCEHAAGKVS